jgi:streptogramin lyase
MNDDGLGNRMADQRATRDVAPRLAAWMAAVAPERPPARLLEESFARTMTSPQLPVFPWHRGPRWRPSSPDRSRPLALVGLAAAVVIALGVGLLPSGRNDGVGAPSASLSPSPSPSPSPSIGPSFPPAVSVVPIATIPVDAPMALGSDGTTIWLFTANSELVRIDSQTNTVTATAKVDLTTDDFQGLAGDDAGLWVTDWGTNQVLRFDPRSLRLVTSIDTAALSKGMLLSGGTLWVANTRGGSVQRIDPTRNIVTATIAVGPTGPSGPNWLAGGLGSVWTGVPNNASVVRINGATNKIEATIPIRSPASPCGGMAAGSTAIWVTSCDGSNFVAQIDPTTNTQVGTIDLGGRGYTIAMVADRPWISPTGGQIVRIDPATHTVDRVIAPGSGFTGGGDVVVAAGSFWVVDSTANRLLRLPIAAFGG